jgi:hypothetical protein
MDMHVDRCRQHDLAPAVDDLIRTEPGSGMDHLTPGKGEVSHPPSWEEDISKSEIASARHQEYSIRFLFF